MNIKLGNHTFFRFVPMIVCALPLTPAFAADEIVEGSLTVTDGAIFASSSILGNIELWPGGGVTAKGTFGSSPVLLSSDQGAGTRMLWHPRKAAFRAGDVSSDAWSESNIGTYSAALGRNTKASGSYSTAFGNSTTASGVGSTALGQGSVASGYRSFAGGYSALAEGYGSFAFGEANVASGGYSVSTGSDTFAMGNFSTAMGTFTWADAYASVALGQWNVGGGSVYDWIPSDPLFEIGNGQDYNTRSNALTVFKNGDMDVQGSLEIGGDLTVEGSPALTTSSAQPILTSQGFLQSSSLESALNNLGSAPVSGVWTTAFVPRGNVSNNAFFAVGGSATASGLNSAAIGYMANASGSHSSARGNEPLASGDFSTSIGDGTVASGAYSTASGLGTVANGSYSSASGYYTTASGAYSSASGYYSTASGPYSSAAGAYSTASGIYSFASGPYATASGFWSTARGNNSKAKSSSETVFGRYNLESNPTSGLTWSGLDGLFRIGNGASGNLSDAVTVLKNGQTILTNKDWKANITANPSSTTAPLEDPSSTTDSGGNALVVDGHAVLNGKVIITVPQGDISMGIFGQ